MTKFQTICADPPWKVQAGPDGGGYCATGPTKDWNWTKEKRISRKLAYPSLTVEQIKGINVPDVTAEHAHLYLWTINKYVEDAYEVARAWGFTPSTLLTWAKKPMGGGLGGTFGISTEFILFARKGRPRSLSRVKGTWFPWKRNYLNGAPAHSRKPEEFMQMVETVSPGPYLEMFARQPRPGWACWGNEVASDVLLKVPTRKS